MREAASSPAASPAARRTGALADAPGPRYATPFSLPREMREQPLSFLQGLFRSYGDLVATRVGPFWSYLVFHPDHIKHILQENNQNYWKGIIVGRAKVLIGDGLFTSEGDVWRRQRRLAQPAFHRQRIAGFATVMTDAARSMLDDWQRMADRHEPFDVSAEMSRVTLRVVGRSLFDVDLQEDATTVGRALLAVLEYVNERAFSFFPLPTWIPTPNSLTSLEPAEREQDQQWLVRRALAVPLPQVQGPDPREDVRLCPGHISARLTPSPSGAVSPDRRNVPSRGRSRPGRTPPPPT